MKKRYSIGFFVITAIILLIILFPLKTNEKTETIEKSIESVTTDGNIVHDKNSYYLYELNGYVVVYLYDKKTPYEYTDILYNDLPEMLQNEIKNGKYIKNVEELYGFLENYSS